MAKKIRNGLTQRQRRNWNKRRAAAWHDYVIRPNTSMKWNWKAYPEGPYAEDSKGPPLAE